MSVSPITTAALAAPTTAGHAKESQASLEPVRVEAAAALVLIRKAIINDPTVGQQLDVAA